MANFSLPFDPLFPTNGVERANKSNCLLLRQKNHSIAVNIARTTIPQMTPAIIGPFGGGLGVSTTTVVVSLGEAEVVDAAVPAFWVVGEGVDVDDETEAEELDTIVSGHVGRLQASTEQQPVKSLATQTYH